MVRQDLPVAAKYCRSVIQYDLKMVPLGASAGVSVGNSISEELVHWN